MVLVEGKEFVEGIRAGDVGVQDKEWAVVFCEDFACKCQRSSCDQDTLENVLQVTDQAASHQYLEAQIRR